MNTEATIIMIATIALYACGLGYTIGMIMDWEKITKKQKKFCCIYVVPFVISVLCLLYRGLPSIIKTIF